MKQKLNTNLEFKTRKGRKSRKKFITFISVALGIFLIASVSLFLLLREYDFDINKIIGRQSASVTDAEITADPADFEGSHNILFIISDNAGKTLHYACIASFIMPEAKIEYQTLDVLKNVSSSGSLSSVYGKNDGSALKIIEIAKKQTGVKIHRYLEATENDFKGLMKIFGSIDFNVENRVSYSVDGVGYIIEKGKQTLTPDMCFKYMYYLSQQHGNDPDTMTELLNAILTNVLTRKRVSSADNYYSKIRSIVKTDISAFDFTANKSRLEAFVSVYDSPAEENS